jgi:hypothetical protein
MTSLPEQLVGLFDELFDQSKRRVMLMHFSKKWIPDSLIDAAPPLWTARSTIH